MTTSVLLKIARNYRKRQLVYFVLSFITVARTKTFSVTDTLKRAGDRLGTLNKLYSGSRRGSIKFFCSRCVTRPLSAYHWRRKREEEKKGEGSGLAINQSARAGDNGSFEGIQWPRYVAISWRECCAIRQRRNYPEGSRGRDLHIVCVAHGPWKRTNFVDRSYID